MGYANPLDADNAAEEGERVMAIKVKHTETKDSVHMEGDGNYATACGLDGDDPKTDQAGASQTKEKINCLTCLQLWETAHGYKKSDFKRGLK